jgi:small basic protein (TIGR04137 family)
MSMDRSLKGKGGLVRHRNVLKRSERITTLKDEERWDESKSVFGLPKVIVRRAVKRKAAAEKKPEAATAEAGAEAPAEGAATPPAKGAAAPAKGAAASAKGAPAKSAKGGKE